MTDAKKIHFDSIVFDAHSDTLLPVLEEGYELGERHTEHDADLPRMKDGGVDIQGLALFVHPRKWAESPKDRAFAMLDAFERQLEKNADSMARVCAASEARRAVAEGKIAFLLGLEGGHAIEDSLDVLGEFYARGVRYLTLTWLNTNNWADSSGSAPRWNGLNEFGFQVVEEMNRLGMMVDLSHTSDATVRDVLSVMDRPVILSHSCARAICDIPRNISDELLEALAKNGAVIGVNYCLQYLHGGYWKALEENRRIYNEKERLIRDEEGQSVETRISDLRKERRSLENSLPYCDTDHRIIVDHIDHIVKTVGVDHVGLGSDYDGVDHFPVGMENVTCTPRITEELVARGYSDSDVAKILGGNFLSVLESVCG